MKAIKSILTLCCVTAVLLAYYFPVAAIDFDAEAAYQSVFVVYSGNAVGSGFAVGENCIVTNAHVIVKPSDVVIQTYGGEEYPVFIIGVDEEKDIAVLGVENVTLPYFKLADKNAVHIGEDVFAIGAPKSMTYTLTKGILSAKDRLVGADTYYQIDAAINEGNSGGPLLNGQGEVLGINTMKIADSEGIGFAIPMDIVCEYLRTLGIVLDEQGNVQEHIENRAQKPTLVGKGPVEEPASVQPHKEASGASPFLYIAFGVAACSLVLNVVLAILLVRQKRKNLKMIYDPRERTDFEIDLLE